MVLPTFILKIICFIILSNILTDAIPIFWYCQQDWGLYTQGSTFQSNLNQLLLSLGSASSSGGFAQNTVANGTDDQIIGAAMCYVDATPVDCKNCLATAVSEIVLQNICGGRRTASVNYNACTLHYYDRNFPFSNIEYWLPECLQVSNDSSSPFFLGSSSVQSLVNQLVTNASSHSNQDYASGEMKYTANQTIYGLVQCTRDLPPDACKKCINGLVEYISNTSKNNCSDSQGSRIMSATCYLRYELSPFTITAPPPLESPLPPPHVSPKSSPSPSSTILPPSIRTAQGDGGRGVLVVIVVVVSVAFLLILSAIIFVIRRRCLVKRRKNIEDEADSSTIYLQENTNTNLDCILNPDVAYLVFDLNTLRDATNNFADMNMLGKGGFGPVYKGILPGWQEIAVKRLSGSSMQGLRELKNEVDFLAKLKHKNLVQLLGCCIGKQEKLLCYEFLPNGSLDNILFDQSKRGELSWNMRYRIIEGINRGLQYLHEESRMKIIHRDLKASNILLDKDMNPKISDFGLARFFEEDQTHKDTSIIAGTFGYMAPEYVLHGNFSVKSDVYSFGVLLLEIITGQKNSSFSSSRRASNLIDYAWQHWTGETSHELKDPTLADENLEEITKCIHIALLCVQKDPFERPSMGAVNHMLAGQSNTLPAVPPTWQVPGMNISLSDVESSTTGRSSTTRQSSMIKSTTKSLEHSN
ncbi:hypothetical protein LUZ60_002374 [Juncus effusus]|nr:hypothetical protein LUZ60_002374 [Juncus effusus]